MFRRAWAESLGKIWPYLLEPQPKTSFVSASTAKTLFLPTAIILEKGAPYMSVKVSLKGTLCCSHPS